jgi:hypothetical protein
MYFEPGESLLGLRMLLGEITDQSQTTCSLREAKESVDKSENQKQPKTAGAYSVIRALILVTLLAIVDSGNVENRSCQNKQQTRNITEGHKHAQNESLRLGVPALKLVKVVLM